MLNTLSAICFLGFLLAALLVRRAERGSLPRRREAAGVFIMYAIVASFGAGLTQHDAWPFAKWPMAAGPAGPAGENSRIVAIDASGLERAIDFRAWQPLEFDELNPWIYRSFPRLAPAAQESVAAHLLAVAERARRHALASGGIGYFDRLLGPLTAPYFDLHPKAWSGPNGVPEEPFTGLRFYVESWDQEARRRVPEGGASGGAPAAVARRLVYEYRRL